jgi:DNA-binding transcriptional LysR family regulator
VELRHLRYFRAVAEELHFARAAERLHIEQSPLSRAIKELEYDLGVQLFERTTRSTRLTWAGQVFLEDVHRIFVAIEQARTSVKAAAMGYHGALRIALSDAIPGPRLTTLLARCRTEEPEVEIRVFQTPFSQQLKGLQSDLYDAGFAQCAEVGEGILVESAWKDPLVVAIPARHPLLAHKHIPLDTLLQYPLVLCHPEAYEGFSRQIERILRAVHVEPKVAEYVATPDLMLTFVAAGYGVTLIAASQIDGYRYPEVIARPLAGATVFLTTYLLRPDAEPSLQLSHFIDRVVPLDSATPAHPAQNEDGIAR